LKSTGFKEIAITSLKLDGSFQHRLDTDRVFERAKSINRLGIISEPGVRCRTYQVIYGRDRIAAAIRAGKTHILCKLWECTDAEARELEISENAHRRHDPERARIELMTMMKLYESQLAEASPAEVRSLLDGARGRSKTLKGLAQRKIAAQRGVKLDSIRRAEHRAKNRENMREVKAERAQLREETAREPSILLMGMEVEEGFVRQTNRIRDLLERAHRQLISAQAILTRITTESLTFPPIELQRLHEAAHELAVQLRRSQPASLCPYCKGLPGVQERCAGCNRTGWIPKHKTEHVPPELWQEGDRALVARDGRYVPLADLFETPSTPTAEPEDVWA
jgi:ParB-like chromosome segregation protein Spo0J